MLNASGWYWLFSLGTQPQVMKQITNFLFDVCLPVLNLLFGILYTLTGLLWLLVPPVDHGRAALDLFYGIANLIAAWAIGLPQLRKFRNISAR